MRGATIGAASAAVLFALVGPAGAGAATLEVTRTNDPVPGACTAGDCSLREAVLRANATPAADRIVLEGKTYHLTQPGAGETQALTGDLNVDPDAGRLTVAGKSPTRTAIDGTDTDRIFEVPAGARLGLSGLTLRNGFTVSSGGAIRSDGSVSIERAALRSNTAALGGGIYSASQANLTVTRTVIAGNDASFGGGLINQNESTARVTRARISGNDTDGLGGAGIFNQNDAEMVVKKSTIDRNVATNAIIGGGGIFNQNQAALRIKDSTISGNRAPGSEGGGIYVQNDAILNLINVTVSGNSAELGGAVATDNFPGVRIAFTTIARNSATLAGGGINDTADPPGPPGPRPYLTLKATLVAGNSAPGARGNCAAEGEGILVSQGANVEDANECGFNKGSDVRNAKAGLRKLARNGGTTRTHALKSSSDAVNAAKKKGCPKRDQRGVKRPQGKRCDSGAYELKRR